MISVENRQFSHPCVFIAPTELRVKGFGVARGRISRFPIDLRRRPYNTLSLPCVCVIALLGIHVIVTVSVLSTV